MNELIDDLWNIHAMGEWVVVTTNGDVRKDGKAVMGRGVARQAAGRFSFLPHALGQRIQQYGNRVYAFEGVRILTFPVKHSWQDAQADLALINKSAHELRLALPLLGIERVYLPRPGCGNGNLSWTQVLPVIEPHSDSRFYIVERPSGRLVR